jgi:hypothetical protein
MSTTHAFAGAFSVMPIDLPAPPARRAPRRVRQDVLRPVNVDLDALEIGARDASDETQSFLDVGSGEVLCLVKGEPDARLLRQRIRAERQRYKKVPAFGLAEERGLLRQFLSQEMDGAGRDFLMRLVDEPGAFHACLTTLKADHALWRAWERFEAAGVRSSLMAWMAGFGVCPAMTLSALMEE